MKYSPFRTVTWIVIVTIAAGIGYYGFLIWSFAKNGSPCQRRAWVVARSHIGDLVEFQEYICAGPAFSMVGSLDLISKTDGGRRRFFEYQEGDGYPGVRWVGNNQLIVSIGRASDVYVRRENVKGIRIRYDIGAIGDRPGRN